MSEGQSRLAIAGTQEKIVFADDMLAKNAVAKIDDGDVILTYGYSSTVFAIFLQAQQVPPLARPQSPVSSTSVPVGLDLRELPQCIAPQRLVR